MVFYGWQQGADGYVWMIAGAILASIGIWHVRACFPERDIY